MRNPQRTGNIAIAQVIAKLVESGKRVLLPFDQASRYDLAIDDGSTFTRVQVKAGWLDQNGKLLRFNACSNNKGYRRRSYKGEIDSFIVYSHELGRFYLIPAADINSLDGRLRLTETANGQQKGVKWARKYELP